MDKAKQQSVADIAIGVPFSARLREEQHTDCPARCEYIIEMYRSFGLPRDDFEIHVYCLDDFARLFRDHEHTEWGSECLRTGKMLIEMRRSQSDKYMEMYLYTANRVLERVKEASLRSRKKP